MEAAAADVIDRLAGVTPGSALDAVRALRSAARGNAQLSYLALFAPGHVGGVTLVERFAVAAFVARLHRQPEAAEFYAGELAAHDPALATSVASVAEMAAADGSYGAYPEGPLVVESTPGPLFRVTSDQRQELGARLAAALEHAHMLVFHPRDAEAAALQELLDAGWSDTDIVTLSQLVAFLAFQIRMVAGLRVFRDAANG